MNRIGMMLMAGAMLWASGCMTVRLGTNSDRNMIEMNGLGSAYATLSGIESYDGTIIEAHLIDSPGQTGELIGLKIWPLGEAGAGLVGARLKLLPLDLGAGILFYEPHPAGPCLRSEESPKKMPPEGGE